MYTFNWALTAFRSESYIGSATALPDTLRVNTNGCYGYLCVYAGNVEPCGAVELVQ